MKYTKKQTTLSAILVLLMFVVLLTFFMVRFKGKSSEFSQEVIETLMAENEDNPESEKYLVTDNCVSRVYPETKIETFVTNFSEGEVIKVYSDKACTQEVTDGFVMSGMYAKYEENNRVFEISVLGDINEKNSKTEENKVLNGDGILNQIELTRDIREAVDDENWKIVDEIEKKSADINCNGEIDEKSVNTIIDYIVFGNLNIEEVPLVKKPTIEVIEGTVNENTVYTSDVILQIHVNEEDCLKTVYKITGDKNQDYKTAIDGEKVVIDKDGVYKITAYTYGQLENKSKREYVIICLDKTANYTMEYYLENEKGEFEKSEEDTKVVEEIIGTKVQIDDKLYTDYELDVDNELSNLNGEVLEDGSLVLRAYYERKSFSYTFIAGNNIEEISIKKNEIDEIENDNSTSEPDEEIDTEETQESNTTEEIDTEETQESNMTEEIDSEEIQKSNTEVTITSKWGTTLTIDAKVKQEDGYKIEWNNWKNINNDEEILAEQKTSLTMQNENRTYEAIATKEVIDYSIVYNLQEGRLLEGITNSEKYNIETLTFTLNNPSKQGYVFKGWTGGVVGENGEIDNTLKTGTTPNVTNPTTTLTIETGSIGNRKYTANWKAIENTPYKVEYYKETLKTGEFVLVESENKEGTTDTEETAEIKDYTGFTFDDQNENNILNGQIKADGSLVLKVYYTRNIYNLTITAGNNIKSVSAEGKNIGIDGQQLEQSVSQGKQTTEGTITLKYKYQQNVTLKAILENLVGYNYTWTGWNSSNTTLMPHQTEQVTTITIPAGNIELTAEATKREKDFNYSIEYYYDNVIDNEKTITKTEKYNTQITTYEEKPTMGYEFNKVEGTPLTISENEEKNKIKVYYKAINYNIVYDLQGGTIDTTEVESVNINQEIVNNKQTVQETNPTTYTINTEDFTLINPTKNNHNFLGWTGGVVDNDGNIIDNPTNEITGTTGNTLTETTTLTVEKGSIGNRKYTANWQQKGYEVIVHHYLQETGPEFNKEPIRVCDDEILQSKVLGADYTTSDIIQKYDDEGNPIVEGDRKYLDPEEFSVVGNSGNTTGTYTEETIEVIYYYKYYPAVRIVSSPVEELNGTEYVTIKDAIEALESKGLTLQSEISKLEILRNVKNESIVIENKNVQIDLAGFTVNSKSKTKPTIKLENSKLIVTDESELEFGKIVSENSSGVYVATNSEFTLGVEEKPVKQTPEIIGYTIGVEKEIIDDNQGIFNFFDGTIKGKIAILGKTDVTPLLYSATVTTDENTNQVANLAIVSRIEARIGRKLYTKLEDAINDANTVIGTDGSQVEIVVVTNIEKSQRVVIDGTKNIKLDLAGYTLTTTANDYVIENQGNLEIVDSTATEENPYGNGAITSSTYSTILNKQSETTDTFTIDNTSSDDVIEENLTGLTITSGNIKLESAGTSSTYKNAIDNEGILNINGGNINSNKNYTNVIRGYNTGVTYIYDGNITGTYQGVALYNQSKLIMKNGNISAKTGILNLSTANIAIETTGGTIKTTGGSDDAAIKNQFTTSKVNLINTTIIAESAYSCAVQNSDKAQGQNYIDRCTITGYCGLQDTNAGYSQAPDYYTFEVKNTTIDVTSSSLYMYSGKTKSIITGGDITGEITNYKNNSIQINNANINSNINNYSSGEITANECTITGSIINDSGIVELNGGTVNYSSDTAITVKSGILKIDNGIEITSSKNPIVVNENGTAYIYDATLNSTGEYYGIVNSGTVTLGKDDENINVQTPAIISEYGISNISGTFNFYDGIIKSAKDKTIVGKVNSIPEGVEVLVDYIAEREIATLGEPEKPVAKIGNTTYTTLQKAVDAVPTNSTNTKIELLKDVYLSETVNIPENKNIALDLMQYTIKGLNAGYVLDNSGIIEINSSSEDTIPVVDISNKVDKANYYFVEQEGTLVSNNAGKKSTTANSYIQIDLSNITGKYELNVNAEISSEINGDIGYATVTQSTSIPNYNTSNGRFMYISGNVPATEYTTTLTGGNIYYLHLGYYKNSSVDSYNDIFKINNISIYPKGTIVSYAKQNLIKNTNKLELNKVDINLYAGGTSSSYLSVIENTGELVMNSGAINNDENKYIISVNNKESGSIVINGGSIINASDNCIESSSTGNITVNGGLIDGLYAIRNISTGNVTVNNGRLNTQKSNGYCIKNSNEEAVVTINNGYFAGYERLISMNFGKLIINDGFLKDATSTSYGNATIEIKNNSLCEIYNGTIYSSYAAIRTTAITGEVIIHDGDIICQTTNLIRNEGTLNILGGMITNKSTSTNSYAIENSETMTISGGIIKGYNGINNKKIATITGGTIEGTSGTGVLTTGTLILGEKDGNVKNNVPSIYGKKYGISSGTSIFNFYDGIIEGASNQSINGSVTEIEEGYEIIKTINSGTSRETTVLDMLPIAENVLTENKYFTLQEAFDDCTDGTEEKVKILRNAIITETVETAIINSNKNIVLDLNGFEISAGNKNTILNKGKLTIKDGTTSQSGKLKNTAEELILLEESGELIIESGNLQEIVNKDLITNNGTGNITVNGGTITIYTASAIVNNGKGNVILNGGTIKSLSGTSTTSGTGILINNGNIEVNDGVIITTSGKAINVNSIESEVVVNGGTLGTSGYGIYNSVACLNVIVNSGTLGCIYNNDAGKIVIGLEDDDVAVPVASRVYNESTGEIIINNASIINSTGVNLVYNDGGGVITINRGNIQSGNGYSAIVNHEGNININGGTIRNSRSHVNVKQAAISNGVGSVSGNCILNLNGGTVVSDSGIAIENGNSYNSTYEAVLNIGKDDGVINNENIRITGATYGIFSYTAFDFYDGTVQGKLNKSIYGRIGNMPGNSEISYEKNTVEIATIGGENVAQIGDTYYNTLIEAINACSNESVNGTTIKLLKDIGIGGTQYLILDGQNIVLDLNGHRINQYCKIINNGTFEVTDNTEEKLGIIDVSDRFIDNMGTFTLSGGKIYSYMNICTKSNETKTIIYNYENGVINISGGNITNTHDSGYKYCSSNVIYTISKNNINLNGGTINLNAWSEGKYGNTTIYAIRVGGTDATNICISGTEMIGNDNDNYKKVYGIYVDTSANITIDSGKLEGMDYAIYKPNDDTKQGILSIAGGDITSSIYIYDFDSVEISSGNITSAATIYNANEIEISGGTISGYMNISTSRLMINDGIITGNLTVSNSGKLTGSVTTAIIAGGNILGNVKFSSANITTINDGTLGNVTFSASNTATINGGNIIGTLTISSNGAKVEMLGGTIDNQSGNGVDLSSGTFTLGVKDYPVSITLPSITASGIGVNRTGGTFNFYDGIITGYAKAISGEVADMPEFYTVHLDEEANVATLGINAVFEQVASINGTYYSSIQEAINASGIANTTIKLEKDNVLSTELIIAENQNITLDLASYSIRTPNEEYSVVNNGNLTIIDTVYTDVSSDEVSEIQNYTGIAIQNNGNLVLGIEDEIVHNKVPRIIGKTYGIENNGTLSIFDGSVQGEIDAIGGTQMIIDIPDGYSYKVELEVVDDTTSRKIFVLCTSGDES